MEISDLYRYVLYSLSIALVFTGGVVVRGGLARVILKASGYLLLLPLTTGYGVFQSSLLLTSIIVSLTTSLYTIGYSTEKYKSNTLQMLVDGLNISILATLSSEYLLELVMFWLMSEIIGFLAISYEALAGVDFRALNSSLKYLIFSMIPTDIALFILLAVSGFKDLLGTPLHNLNLDVSPPILTVMVLLGFIAKAGVIPLHFWLPDAHSIAPAPISAILSGVMVKMGVYGFAILSHYTMDVATAFQLLFAFGSLSAVYGALQALVQQDIKRLLAYSTISNTGILSMLTALYIESSDPLFMHATLVFLVSHTLYKATLFIDSGVIELIAHERSIEGLGYIYRVAPLETFSALLSILSMFGMPPAVGFIAKILVFSALLKYTAVSWIYTLALIIMSIEIALTVAYSARYLQAHMRVGGETPSMNMAGGKVLSLSQYVLTLSATHIITTPLLLASGISLSVDITVLYIVSLPLLLITLATLYKVLKQSGG